MSVMEGLRAPKLFTNRVDTPEPRSERCLNCGAAMAGPYCAQCGQRDIPPYPSIRELVTDAFWELSGWDGRFAATVRALVQAPGRLTIDFLEGRRARYISPLRLYLLASLLYFLAAAAAPQVTNREGVVVSQSLISIDTTSGAGKVSAAAQQARGAGLTPQQRDSALKRIEKAPRIMRPILARAVTDAKGLQHSLLEKLPRVLFALVPVFAAILGLFYRKRKYPEHLYFGLHLHAFFFVALTIAAAAKFTHSAMFSGWVSFAMLLWMLGYSASAARRVYGGSWGGTIAKGVGVTALYSVAGVIGLCIAIYLAALS